MGSLSDWISRPPQNELSTRSVIVQRFKQKRHRFFAPYEPRRKCGMPNSEYFSMMSLADQRCELFGISSSCNKCRGCGPLSTNSSWVLDPIHSCLAGADELDQLLRLQIGKVTFRLLLCNLEVCSNGSRFRNAPPWQSDQGTSVGVHLRGHIQGHLLSHQSRLLLSDVVGTQPAGPDRALPTPAPDSRQPGNPR